MIIFSNNLSLEIKIFIEKCFRIEFTEGYYDKMKKNTWICHVLNKKFEIKVKYVRKYKN